jgi:hypothetical protein
MTFSERNVAPRTPTGPDIPDGVRVSLLAWFNRENGTTPTHLWTTLCQREGYGDFTEIEDDLRERFGDEDANAFMARIRDHWARDRGRMTAMPGVDYNAEPALKAIPPALFLDVLEYALQNSYAYLQGIEEINRIFSKRGVFYRFNYSREAEWHGDQGLHEALLRPALDVLTDPRLIGVASEFGAALRHLRAGAVKDREDAIEEAAKAVESVMKVTCDVRAIARSGKETATPLFEKLRDGGIVEAEADSAVLAAARIRNQWGGHGSGGQPRDPPQELAELAVRVAATAIVFFGSRLP